MLTRVRSCAAPSAMQPGDTPVSVMVLAGPTLNAPGSFCRQATLGDTVQSALVLQGFGGFAKPAKPSPQKPKKTKFWGPAAPTPGMSADVLVCVPTERLNAIGRLPVNAATAGGQSWLVGFAAGTCPGMGEDSATQA